MASSKQLRRIYNATEREIQILNLRMRGYSYTEIGKMLGIAPQAAHKATKKALAKRMEYRDLLADELREQQLMLLDAMLTRYAQQALDGDQQSAKRVLEIIEQRSKLLGLEQVHVQLPGDIEVVIKYAAADATQESNAQD
jgi:predicted transcriptional regulator